MLIAWIRLCFCFIETTKENLFIFLGDINPSVKNVWKESIRRIIQPSFKLKVKLDFITAGEQLLDTSLPVTKIRGKDELDEMAFEYIMNDNTGSENIKTKKEVFLIRFKTEAIKLDL